MANTTLPRIKKANLKIGKKFKLNGWLVFDGIALIVIVGVLAVRMSHAGIDYTFTRTPQQMTAGSLQRSITGGDYRNLVADGIHAEASVVVSVDDIAASRQVCAQMHVNSGDTFVDIQLNGHYANKFVKNASDVTICVDVNNEAKGGTVYAGTSGNADVYSIYGTR